METIRYFAISEGSGPRPTGLMREVETDDEYRLEHVDASGQWVLNYDLARYLFNGEGMADEIDADKAAQVARSLVKKTDTQDSVRMMRMAGLPVKRS